jgi:hypothetical protein
MPRPIRTRTISPGRWFACIALTGCAGAPVEPTRAPAATLTVLAACDRPPIAAQPTAAQAAANPGVAPLPFGVGRIGSSLPWPTVELDLAAFRGKVVWLTFYTAEC